MDLNLKPDILWTVFGMPVTNTFLSALLVSVLLILVAFRFSRKVELIPGSFQNFVEYVIEFMYDTALETVGNKKKTIVFFPIVATYFLFIILCNWSGLIPIWNNIGFYTKSHEFIPLLRPANTDLNITASLAIISAVATQYFAIKYRGILKHLNRYFSLNPINLFVGILELVSEFTKVISLSLRLYGNILAGDVVISTFTSLVGILIPLPFMGMEVMVGFVQATVFAMLTLAFTNVLSSDLH